MLIFVRSKIIIALLALLTAISVPADAAGPATGNGRIDLTPRERQWLAEHPVIRVAPDPAYQPIESLDENGRLVGITVDFLRLIEDRLAIRFEIVPVASWDEAMQRARNRTVDMLSAATKTSARSEYMAFTTPHIELPGVIIVRSDAGETSNLDQLRGKSVGVVSNYVWQEWIARDYPDIDQRPVRDMQTGLLLVSFGQLDAMVGNLATATHFLKKLGITNLRVAGETGYYARLAIATRRDWPLLNAILQKAVSSISPEKNRAILDKWIKLKTPTLLDTRTILWGALLIVALIGVAVAANMAWNYSLRQMVRRQSADLRESEARFRAIVEDQTEFVARSLPGSYRLTFVNPAYCRCFGETDDALIGTSFLDHIPEEDRDAVAATLATLSADNPVVEIEHRCVTADGEIRWHLWSDRAIFDAEGDIVEIQAVGRDITERRRTEERLRHAQKMEAVGQLTGGIAHDFNNLLTIIQGNAELVARDANGHGAEMQAIVRASRRGAELTHRLLAFSRQQPLNTQTIDLAAHMADISELLGRTLEATIDIELKLAADLWPVLADPGQLENAILNLAINARDAMPGGGTLTIECSNVRLDADRLNGHSEAPAGDYVALAVSDTGMGMSAEVLTHAFEPFFTTKEVGEGSGLGLAMIYGFASQSGGLVDVSSEEGKGTTMTLFLPRAKGEGEPEPADAAADAISLGRGERILVIEDDDDVRELAVSMLEGLNYRVISVPSVIEARDALANGAPIDLVLSDMVLPGGKSGADFAAETARIRPEIRFVIMSGYPAMAAGQGDFPGRGNVLIGKPFERGGLARVVRDTLDRDRATTADMAR